MTQKHTVERFAISLPAELMARVERLREETGTTRSGLVRLALEEFLRSARRARRVASYIEGYAREPESLRDVEAVKRAAAKRIAEDPWE